ncbi:TraB domain containing 2A [Crotalus adamanteus]|uniref:TraB domain containing 2A n=1 Tax=Crotalus adamanteus TaxID=8729 RepID=A0AAW1C0F6_CROAD
MVVDLDAGLQEFQSKGDGLSGPCRPVEKPRSEGRVAPGPGPGPSAGTPRLLPRCFRCNQLGHWVPECPVPVPQEKPGTPGRAGATPKKTPEKLRAEHQAEGPTPWGGQKEEATATTRYQLVAYNSEAVEDPMASEPIRLFVIPIILMGPQTSHLPGTVEGACDRRILDEGSGHKSPPVVVAFPPTVSLALFLPWCTATVPRNLRWVVAAWDVLQQLRGKSSRRPTGPGAEVRAGKGGGFLRPAAGEFRVRHLLRPIPPAYDLLPPSTGAAPETPPFCSWSNFAPGRRETDGEIGRGGTFLPPSAAWRVLLLLATWDRDPLRGGGSGKKAWLGVDLGSGPLGQAP